MSKASEIRAAFNDGFQAGIVDTVGQDKARLNLATALLITEVANIIRGGKHECSPDSIAASASMPHSNGRCCSCSIVAFTGDSAVGEYIRVMENIKLANDDDTE